jgi:uncharacterized membrane protein
MGAFARWHHNLRYQTVVGAGFRIGLMLWLFVAVGGCGCDDDRPPVPTPTPPSTSTPTFTPTSTPTPTSMAAFRGVGFLSDGSGASSRAFGISRDGTTVVGGSASPDGFFEAFRWTVASGIEGLGFPAGKVNSEAFGANQNGSVVVGSGLGEFATAPRGARWSEGAGWELLRDGAEDFNAVQARGISADGNTLAGAIQFVGGIRIEAVLWTPTTGIQRLGLLDGNATTATDVSADGTVVCGYALLETGERQGVRWTSDSGLEALPFLDGTDCCVAQRVSADGRTIVGLCGPENDPEAVLWDSRGVVGLGDLPDGIGSFLEAVSGDGSVAVGGAGDTQGDQRAAIWTAATGMQDLRAVLVGLGLETELEGWFLVEANAISSDGRALAGVGIDPQGRQQGFVATLP